MRPLRHLHQLAQAPLTERSMNRVSLTSSVIHVWWVDLDELSRSGRYVAGYLSPDEQLRAERSSGGILGSRFGLGRGCLREIIGLYRGVHPALVRFEYGPYEKPRLARVSGADCLTFSVSYADRLMVVAVGAGGEIGVDVEPLIRCADIAPIVDVVFSQGELALLGAMTVRKREAAMVRGWTGKEAILKADGRGLMTNLATIEVLTRSSDSNVRAACHLHAVPVPVSGYVASLAVAA